MNKEILKPFLHYLYPILIFLAVSVIYFYPSFSGYKLKQGDITSFKGMSKEISDYKEKFGEDTYWTNSLFGGMPTYLITVKSKTFFRSFLRGLARVAKSPTCFFLVYAIGFFILLTAIGIDRWLATIGALSFAFSADLLIIIEAGHTSKAFAIGFMAPVVAGVIHIYRGNYKLGAVITTLALAFQIASAHVQITYYLMLILLCYLGYFLWESIKKKEVKKFIRHSSIVLVAVVAAILVNVGYLITTKEFTKHTIRGESELTINPDGTQKVKKQNSGLDIDYATQWSYGIEESLSLLIPNVKGGKSGSLITSQQDFAQYSDPATRQFLSSVYGGQFKGWPTGYVNTYWGNQPFTSGNPYVGAVVFYLFILAMFLFKAKWKWPFFIVSVLALMLAWGKNFMGFSEFFMNNIPLYNKFRAVTMILVIIEFSLPLIAFAGVYDLVKNTGEWEKKKKQFYIVSASFLGIMLLMLASPDSFLTFLSHAEQNSFQNQLNSNSAISQAIYGYIDGIKEIRIGVFRSDLLRSLFFVACTALLVWFKLERNMKLNQFYIGLAVLIMVDLWVVDKRYLNNEKVKGNYVQWEKKDINQFPFTPSAADLTILQNETSQSPEVARAVNEATQEWQQNNRGQAARNKNALYAAQFSALNFSTNYRVLNFAVNTFNDATTSYFHKSLGGYNAAKLQRIQDVIEFHMSGRITPQILNMFNTKYIIRNTGNGLVAIQNPDALGNTWFVKEVKWVKNADEEIQALSEFDPEKEVIVDEKFKELVVKPDVDSTANITLESYLPNHLIYNSKANTDQLAVFSEVYYEDDWHLYVDGKELPHFKVNYLLRGAMIPAGEHTVEFKFEPESAIALAGFEKIYSYLLLLGCILLLYKYIKSNKSIPAKEVEENLS